MPPGAGCEWAFTCSGVERGPQNAETRPPYLAMSQEVAKWCWRSGSVWLEIPTLKSALPDE